MKVAGIIAEYNPFHNGHAYHIDKTRQSGITHIVAAMDGCFTQRGEPSCLSKAARCKAALLNGADLIIELPVPWAVSSAETFAHSAVYLLNSLGCIDQLSFGSENGDIQKLKECAQIISRLNDSQELKTLLRTGISFPKARELTISKLYPEIDPSPLCEPNDTLAVEYLKALANIKSGMEPIAVRRQYVQHNDNFSDENFASAGYIRKLLASGNLNDMASLIPESAFAVYKSEIAAGRAPINPEYAHRIILSQLRRLSKVDWSRIQDVTEGLEHRILGAMEQASDFDDLALRIKSKRFTLSRIRRILINAFLNIFKSDTACRPPYIRILGFNGRGLEILQKAKKTSSLPIISRYADLRRLDEQARHIFQLESLASDLYELFIPKRNNFGQEQRYKLIDLTVENSRSLE